MSARAGFNFLGNSLQGSWNTSITGQLQGTRGNRKLFAAAQDDTKQESFQEAFSNASQAAHDIRTSELSDEGKRYVSSLNASEEKSNQYRREASTSLQKSQSLSQMASFTKQNSGSIHANLKQEYVEWLQTQELPNTQGPMGIKEAEVILSSRPELDHAYQNRFLNEKMASSGDLSKGLPTGEEDLNQAFEDVFDASNTGSNLYADSAYRGGSIDGFVEEKLLTDKRQHRAYRGNPLNGDQKRANTSPCKVRAKGEHVFAWNKNWRQRFQIRSIGLVRAGFAIGLNTLIDHMRRLVFLSDAAFY